MISPAQGLVGAASGSLIGFSLGLVGGGGSILAVPLIVYAVGIPDAHLAVGTSAVAVAANATANLIGSLRGAMVKWQCALMFSLAGIGGAVAGSFLGKMVESRKLLGLFAILMIAAGIMMLMRRSREGDPLVRLHSGNLPALLGFGLFTGLLSGFFGIGGGFLIVPALVLATDMPVLYAVNSSMVAVALFSLTTATSYAISGLVEWPLAGLLLAGGIVGGIFGRQLAIILGGQRRLLTYVFVAVIFAMAAYVLFRSVSA